MKAMSTGKWRTIVEAPKGSTSAQLEKKARKYIKGKFKIKKS